MPTPPYDAVALERVSPHVVRLVLNRPERLNALTWPMIDELHDAVARIAADTEIRVVVLAGRGRAFCSGLDLRLREDPLGSDDGVVTVHRRQERIAGLVVALRDLPQPVVAAVDGPAAGGGLALALAADLRICTTIAAFDAGFSRIGLSGGDAGVSSLLPGIVGHGEASRILLTAARVPAAEARAIGLVSEVVDPDDLAGAALALADRIADLAPYGVWMTKQLLHRAADGAPLRTVLDLENRAQVLATRSDDAREGVRAFRERRAPRFAGR